MAQVDSVDKIVQRYFSAISNVPFQYKGVDYQPKSLRVSEGIFVKRMTCVEKCGACCSRFSLDYIPPEYEKLSSESKSNLTPKEVKLGDKTYQIWSDSQSDNEGYYCRHLKQDNGRCGIHGSHPFTCDFELLRFHHFEDPDTPEGLGHRPFGRGWAMKTIDGSRGALCEWYDAPTTREWIEEINRKLLRLQVWAEYFGLKTKIPQIMDWVDRGPHVRPLIVKVKEEKGGFF